jgi:hypothetical protein
MAIPPEQTPPTSQGSVDNTRQTRVGHSSQAPKSSPPTALTVGSPKSLPVPSAEGVRQFQSLYERRYGTVLSESEALDLATRYLHLVYFATTPLPPNGESDE